MIDDLEQLYNSILNTHPAPYTYCSKDEFETAYSKAIASSSSSKSVIEFTRIVSSFVKVLRDSHTSFNPRDLLFMEGKKRKLVPFYVMEFDHKFYLSRIYNNELPVGVEMVSVGELSMDSLYHLTMAFCPNEAMTQSSKKEIIPKMMGNVFNVHNIPEGKTLLFRYINKTGDTVQKEVPYIRLRQFDKKGNWYPSKEVEFEFVKEKGYLRVYSFETKNEKRFKKVVNEFFKEVKSRSCTDVVIDVRENRGGYVLLLEHLLSYINTSSKTLDFIYTYKRSELDRFESLSRIKKMDFIRSAEKVYPRGMISKEYDFYKSPKGTVCSITYQKTLANSSGDTYSGKCTLFMNGLSMSASVLLGSWFKETQRGEIAGTPCFGTLSGTNGNPATIFLKHSGLPVSISTLKLTPSAYKKTIKTEFSVDRSITVNLKDVRSGVDPFKRFLTGD